MSTTSTAIQSVFQLVDREVWIVTASACGHRGGLVATWVSAVSIDPDKPCVLVGLAPNHFTTELVKESGGFAVHLLDWRHIDLVWRFGLASGRDNDKLGGLGYRTATTGSPILAECLAWLDCRVVAQYNAGDRLFFWADVVAGKAESQGRPLRESDVLGSATPDQRAQLAAGKAADVRSLTGLRQKWLESAAIQPRPPDLRTK
jgi:flavin reductase (DIM6/NTAB) family NADH-FMN oxidoreductase RutF